MASGLWQLCAMIYNPSGQNNIKKDSTNVESFYLQQQISELSGWLYILPLKLFGHCHQPI